MSTYSPMPEKVILEMMERNNTLLRSLQQPVPEGELEHPKQKVNISNWKPPMKYKEKRLSCPVMTPSEVQMITLSMKDASNKEGALNDLLKEHGVAIVTDVTCPRDTSIMEELFKSDLLALASASTHPSNPDSVKNAYHRLKSEGPSAWPQSTLFSDKFSYKRGLEQGAYAWACRTHPNVKKVCFVAYIYNFFFFPVKK